MKKYTLLVVLGLFLILPVFGCDDIVIGSSGTLGMRLGTYLRQLYQRRNDIPVQASIIAQKAKGPDDSLDEEVRKSIGLDDCVVQGRFTAVKRLRRFMCGRKNQTAMSCSNEAFLSKTATEFSLEDVQHARYLLEDSTFGFAGAAVLLAVGDETLQK